MNRIQARSPFLIKYTETDLVSAVIRIFVYTGTQDDTTDRDAGFSYQADITALSGSDEVIFDASEIIDSILEVDFDGAYNSQIVWVDYDVTPTTTAGLQSTTAITNLEAYSGFRYFEEGAQNMSREDDTNKILLSNACIYKGHDSAVRIPVIADSAYDVVYVKDGQVVYTESVASSVESTDRIKYISNEPVNGVDNYADRVLTDGGTIEESYCLDSFLRVIELYDLDYILVGDDMIKIKPSMCTKHDSYKITFVNKYGALQDVYFNGKSEQSMSSKVESNYLRNTIVSDSYSINKHTKEFVNKNANDMMNLSTSFVSEDYTEVFKELQLSRKVWIEKDNLTLPVDIKGSDFKYKNKLNDKLISFNIEIEFSFNTISNIR